ncbi:LysR family transcriptional regulator [Sphaerisporangium album]|uniref:LysR family transcriptional regulator n=1 Tax=Sphaerisporangium album TaxID=509200 RepID=A0A367FNL6_9ACTN|nr:LysR family transcriptional regulator [Sphaerisporangium album]RCG31499.1 LysR family transcriptional regulator [Sphaerisporangium album]
MLNLERLRVLHAVSTTGSVVGAARTLHVTTSAVSQQMARLEREVGQPLVERQGRGIRLTEAGALLARHAGELLAHVERVESGLAEHRGAVTGPLAIAAFATAARGLLPDVLRDLRSRHPDLWVTLSEREPHEAVPALRRGLLDVAVVQDWPDDVLAVPDDLVRRHLLDDTFDLALPVGHPLARRERVAVKELAGDDWISWSAGQICHDWLVRTLRADGAEPRVVHTASEHSTQIALVAAGLGVAVIPRLGREPAPPSVSFVPIDPPPARRVFALWRLSATARPAIGAAVDALCRFGALAD